MATSEERILDIVGQYYPELDAGPGTPFYEYVVRPMAFLWAKHDEAANEFLLASDMSNYLNMEEEDLDRLMSKFFITRKVGAAVTANIRLNFYNRQDYTIPADTAIDLGGGRIYRVPNIINISGASLASSASDASYYAIIPIISVGTGNLYNLLAKTTVPVDAIAFDFAENLKSAYVESDSTDGGYTETNAQLYYRAQNSLSLKNLTTYRGVKAALFDNFAVTEVTPIGLRDMELLRDLITVNISSTSTPDMLTFHRGGMADIYVNNPPYSLVEGYSTKAGRPLGFPYNYTAKDGTLCSIITNPTVLMQKWAADIASDTAIAKLDKTLRGSVLEDIPTLSALKVSNLTCNINALHEYVTSTDNEALHSDNLIKQYWPIVVKIALNIIDPRGAEVVDALKARIVDYVNNLYTTYYPRTDDLVHLARGLGIAEVHLPVSMDAYYLTDDLHLEHFSILTDMVGNNREPYNSMLIPLESDTLKFSQRDDRSQLSPKTCRWYTDANLVSIALV